MFACVRACLRVCERESPTSFQLLANATNCRIGNVYGPPLLRFLLPALRHARSSSRCNTIGEPV
jgi:hypothetical protein